jgi:phytanoyl-CoA hydroxylase
MTATDTKGILMLTDAQRAAYDRDGFIVVPDVFSATEIDELRRVTDDFVRQAAPVTANDAVYDLEDSHTQAEPRVRRLKAPHLIHQNRRHPQGSVGHRSL